jgi:hypothetical protein
MGEPCKEYSPWNEQDPNPLAMAECVDYDDRGGLCLAPLSPHEFKPCPWKGYAKKKVDNG